jgi:hypothetical protein
MQKIKFTNKSILNFEKLSNNHNLGKLSDVQFDTFQNAILNFKKTSYTTDCYVGIMFDKEYLSFDYKEFIPVIGNRISSHNGSFHYVILNNNGQIIKKLRL